MTEKYNVAVVGVTGAVGEAMLNVLAERDFPVAELYPLASERSVGKTVEFNGRHLRVQNLAEFDFSQAQIALFSAGGSVSAEFAPKAAEAGCIVVDNTSHFRMDPEIPLVVPECNAHAIGDAFDHVGQQNIIANPNCSTIQMLVALKPIQDAVGIDRINVATYQAVSGTGKNAIEELAGQTARLLNGMEIEAPQAYPKQIAFNALPHIDVFQENGYTKEEMKMVWETRKIFEDESILVNPTCVRIPVFYGHAEAVHIETRDPLDWQLAQELLANAPGVIVLDERADGGYPTPVTEAVNQDKVYVGRIRQDISHPNGLNLWIVADNVRKGAATNSVQIAEILVNQYI